MTYTKIKNFEDACKATNNDPSKLPDVSMLPEKHSKSITAYYQLVIIAQALNDGWEPNWNDSDERKYNPYFWIEANDKNTAGVGFEDSHYDFWGTCALVGSRLCFKSSDLAEYAAETFGYLYKDYLLLT